MRSSFEWQTSSKFNVVDFAVQGLEYAYEGRTYWYTGTVLTSCPSCRHHWHMGLNRIWTQVLWVQVGHPNQWGGATTALFSWVAKILYMGWCVCIVAGFISNVVRPLFTEWHRLLASPLSLLLLDNLQANLQRWQSASTDSVSLLTVPDSSDDSSPSNADHRDRQQLSVSGELGTGRLPAVQSDGDGGNIDGGPQTDNLLRRASLPPLSATAGDRITVRRGSTPAVATQRPPCRRVYFLSSLAEDPSPLLTPPPKCSSKRPKPTSDADETGVDCNEGLHNVCKNGQKDIFLKENNVRLPGSESQHCSADTDSTFQYSKSDSSPVIYADDCAYSNGSNGALLGGVSLMLPPKCRSVRRGSAPVVCSSGRLKAACATRRGSAPSPGAGLIAVSLWKSKLPFDARELSSAKRHCHPPSVVVVESPLHLNVGVDHLSVVCMLTDKAGSLKSPLDGASSRCREKRSHSAHAVVISPTRFTERRYSSPLCTHHHCCSAASLINQSTSSNTCTPPSISGLVQTVDVRQLV